MNIAPALAETPNHPIAQGAFDGPIWIGWWTGIGIILIAILWNWIKRKKISIASVVVSVALIVLGILSSMGALETEHGHGIDSTNSGFEVEHPHEPNSILDHGH